MIAFAAGLNLGFRVVPLSQWLTSQGNGCVKLNCEVVGSRPWDITYRVKGYQLSRSRYPNITPLSDGSLQICNVNVDRHAGTYRCTVSSTAGSSAYKEIRVQASALRRYVSNTNTQRTTNTNPLSFIRVTNVRTRSFRKLGQNCLEVTCVAEGSPEPLTYRFRYNNQPVPNNFQYPTMTLNRAVLTYCPRNGASGVGDYSSASGEYTCTASNSLPRSASRTLSVQIRPQPTFSPLPRPVIQAPVITSFTHQAQSGCLLFSCSATPRDADISISLNGRTADSEAAYTSVGKGQMKVCDIDLNRDSGIGVCTARDGSGREDSRSLAISSSDSVVADLLLREGSTEYGIHLSKNSQGCMIIDCITGSPGQVYIALNSRYTTNNPRYRTLANGSKEICDVDPTVDGGSYQCTTYRPEFRTYQKQLAADDFCSVVGINCPTAAAPSQDLSSFQRQLKAASEELRMKEATIQQLQEDLRKSRADMADCDTVMGGIRSLVRPCN